MSSLDTYIQNLLKQGYDIQSIKNYLLKYGYPEQTIDQAIYNLNKTEVHHTIHLTKNSLIAILAIVIGLIITSFFIFWPESTPENLLDVNIYSIDSEVEPGKTLSASIKLTNMGSKNRYDIYLKYEVYNEDTEERLTFKSETIALETTKDHNAEISLPKDAKEGNYILQVTARYQGESAHSTTVFQIKSDKPIITESCEDNIKNQGEEDIDCGGPCEACKACPTSCDDNNPITIDFCNSKTDFKCEYETPAICGDKTCSETENTNTCPDDCMEKEDKEPIKDTWSELERIKELAKTNPSRAEGECSSIADNYIDQCLQNVGEIAKDSNICGKIGDQYNRERCFAGVAKSLNKKALCENIEKDSRRDNCYINFAIDGDYSVCEKITNPYLKKSCETLKQSQ